MDPSLNSLKPCSRNPQRLMSKQKKRGTLKWRHTRKKSESRFIWIEMLLSDVCIDPT